MGTREGRCLPSSDLTFARAVSWSRTSSWRRSLHVKFAAKVDSKAMQLAHAARPDTPTDAPQVAPMDVLDQLERLSKLRDSGVITEDELAPQKAAASRHRGVGA